MLEQFLKDKVEFLLKDEKLFKDVKKYVKLLKKQCYSLEIDDETMAKLKQTSAFEFFENEKNAVENKSVSLRLKGRSADRLKKKGDDTW